MLFYHVFHLKCSRDIKRFLRIHSFLWMLQVCLLDTFLLNYYERWAWKYLEMKNVFLRKPKFIAEICFYSSLWEKASPLKEVCGSVLLLLAARSHYFQFMSLYLAPCETFRLYSEDALISYLIYQYWLKMTYVFIFFYIWIGTF